MHLALTVLQLKAEAAVIRRNPQFEMEDRLLLSRVDYAAHTVEIDGARYPLNVRDFPTIDPADPFAMSAEERHVLDRLTAAFAGSAKLRAHAHFLLNNGGVYLACNGNLLYHGCIPMTEDRQLKPVALFQGEPPLRGRALLDRIETAVREGAYAPHGSPQRRASLDVMWYLWCGADSPLFGKDRLTLFERSFLSERTLWHEGMDPYYRFRNERAVCEALLLEFGLDPDSGCIINGHVPVKVVAGESPIKAGGKLLVIDGGFARAYQPVTGLAGYTLIYNSKGLILAALDPVDASDPDALLSRDIISHTLPVWLSPQRILVRDTDLGREIQAKIADLMDLLQCYTSAQLKER
jgi:fructose-1,6-bisphosphatase-3